MSTTALMTFAEFEQLPEMPGKQELVNGRLVTMPPPENKHSLIAARIFSLFLTRWPAGRAWGDHTGYRVGDGWVEPDASVSWPDQPKDDKYLLQAPMVAVEILSPGEDIEEKLTLYFDEGALEVWVINIRRETMTVYLRSDNTVTRLKVEHEYRSAAAEVTVSLSAIFS
jgi:Uma2 family endonuclease